MDCLGGFFFGIPCEEGWRCFNIFKFNHRFKMPIKLDGGTGLYFSLQRN